MPTKRVAPHKKTASKAAPVKEAEAAKAKLSPRIIAAIASAALVLTIAPVAFATGEKIIDTDIQAPVNDKPAVMTEQPSNDADTGNLVMGIQLSESASVSYNLEDVDSSMDSGDVPSCCDYSTVLTATEAGEHIATVSVNAGGTEYPVFPNNEGESGITFDAATNTLTIPAALMKGSIVISATASDITVVSFSKGQGAADGTCSLIIPGSGTVTATYGMQPSDIEGLTATRAGYDFAGFYDNEDPAVVGAKQYFDAQGKAVGTWDKAVDEVTLYAVWTPGDPPEVDAHLALGDTITAASAATKSIYTITADSIPTITGGALFQVYSISVDTGYLKLTNAANFRNGIVSSTQGDTTPVTGQNYLSVEYRVPEGATIDSVKADLESIQFVRPTSGSQTATISSSPYSPRTGESTCDDIYYNGHFYQVVLAYQDSPWLYSMNYIFDLKDTARYPGFDVYPATVTDLKENQMLVTLYTKGYYPWLGAVPKNPNGGTITVNDGAVFVTGSPSAKDSSSTDPYISPQNWVWIEGTPEAGQELPGTAGDGIFWQSSNPENGGPIWFGHTAALWDDLEPNMWTTANTYANCALAEWSSKIVTAEQATVTVNDDNDVEGLPIAADVTVTNGTWNQTTAQALSGEEFAGIIAPAAQRTLPNAITVTVGDAALPESDYTYDKATGTVTIPSAKVTGDITIKVICPKEQATVTLFPNDGAGGKVSVTAEYGKPMPDLTGEGDLPTRMGYDFLGYFYEPVAARANDTLAASETDNRYYNADGTSAKNWDLPEDDTLVAHWEFNFASYKQAAIDDITKKADDEIAKIDSDPYLTDNQKEALKKQILDAQQKSLAAIAEVTDSSDKDKIDDVAKSFNEVVENVDKEATQESLDNAKAAAKQEMNDKAAGEAEKIRNNSDFTDEQKRESIARIEAARDESLARIEVATDPSQTKDAVIAAKDFDRVTAEAEQKANADGTAKMDGPLGVLMPVIALLAVIAAVVGVIAFRKKAATRIVR